MCYQMRGRLCLRCDLRLLLTKPILPPKKELLNEFVPENIESVPEKEGVYQLLDEQENVLCIKGTMNLQQELQDKLEVYEKARLFMYELEQMYTKRESELIQQYLQEHGEMPGGGEDELDDLF